MTVKFYLEGIYDVLYEGTDAGTWNGWAVPILSDVEYQRLKNDIDGEITRESGEPYEGIEIIETPRKWLCQGLCFVKAEEEERAN